MIPRAAEARLHALLRTFPVVLVVGPRQAGKTTLVRTTLPGWQYLDLERPRDYDLLTGDAEGYFEASPERVIVDEVQRYPALFPLLRHLVDRRRRPGRFVLTGSAHPSLLRHAGETLAGRAAVLELTPFGTGELAHTPRWMAQRWFWGGYPPLYTLRNDTQKRDWLEHYLTLFLERDLPLLGVIIAPAKLRRFWTMLAHVHGQTLNLSDLARAMDLSHHTIGHYLDILEGAFMIRRLLPYHANIGKRLVKSPKVYIRDSGLLHYFSGLRRPSELSTWPKVGASFEGMVLEEVARRLAVRDPGAQLFYWRTQAGAEVDLIVESGRTRHAIEIKSGHALSRHAWMGLHTCCTDLKISRGMIVYRGSERLRIMKGIEAVDWDTFQREERVF